MLSNRQLKHALALQRHGSFRRAAEAMHISQPAFSRSIGSLEKQLGATLFDRGPKAVTPTVFGEALLLRARTIIDETEELRREIDLLNGLDTGGLAVAMGIYPAEISGSGAAAEFARRYPHLHCRFMLGDWVKVANEVLSGVADLGLSDINFAEADDRLATEVVGRHQVVFYCRKGHPLTGLADVSKARIDRYPLVAIRVPARIAASCPGGTTIDTSTGMVVPLIEVEDVATARAIVAASDAVSGGAPAHVQALVSTGEFEMLPFNEADVSFNYGFIYLKNRMLSPAANAFMSIVRDIEERVAAANGQLLQAMFSEQGAAT